MKPEFSSLCLHLGQTFPGQTGPPQKGQMKMESGVHSGPLPRCFWQANHVNLFICPYHFLSDPNFNSVITQKSLLKILMIISILRTEQSSRYCTRLEDTDFQKNFIRSSEYSVMTHQFLSSTHQTLFKVYFNVHC